MVIIENKILMWKTLNRGFRLFLFFRILTFPGALPPSPMFFKEQASAASLEAPQIECSEGRTEGWSAVKNCSRGSLYIIHHHGGVCPLMAKHNSTQCRTVRLRISPVVLRRLKMSRRKNPVETHFLPFCTTNIFNMTSSSPPSLCSSSSSWDQFEQVSSEIELKYSVSAQQLPHHWDPRLTMAHWLVDWLP